MHNIHFSSYIVTAIQTLKHISQPGNLHIAEDKITFVNEEKNLVVFLFNILFIICCTGQH